MVFRVPGDLEKGGLVVDLSQQSYRYKICNELKGHACGDAQASLLEGNLVYFSISSSKEQFVWLPVLNNQTAGSVSCTNYS